MREIKRRAVEPDWFQQLVYQATLDEVAMEITEPLLEFLTQLAICDSELDLDLEELKLSHMVEHEF